jgi:hypothetical protein
MALLIKADGTSQEVEVPKEDRIDFYQKCVGGYYEIVRLPDDPVHILLVNEEGLLKRPVLFSNMKAIRLTGLPIVGDALLVKIPEEFD